MIYLYFFFQILETDATLHNTTDSDPSQWITIHLKLASKFSIGWLSSLVALCAGCVQRMYCSAAAAVYKHYLYEIYNGDTIRLSFILRVRALHTSD